MKNIRSACICVFILFGALASSQEMQEVRRELKNLAFTDQEFDAVEKIVSDGESVLEKAQGEIKVIQAKLEVQMKAKDPPIEEIRKLVRESLEWEYQIRMVKLERNIAIRKAIGDDRWGKAFKLARRYKAETKPGKDAPDANDPKAGRGFKLLDSLQ